MVKEALAVPLLLLAASFSKDPAPDASKEEYPQFGAIVAHHAGRTIVDTCVEYPGQNDRMRLRFDITQRQTLALGEVPDALPSILNWKDLTPDKASMPGGPDIKDDPIPCVFVLKNVVLAEGVYAVQTATEKDGSYGLAGMAGPFFKDTHSPAPDCPPVELGPRRGQVGNSSTCVKYIPTTVYDFA